MSKQNLLWNEKYRPRALSECVLPDRLVSIFQSQLDKGELQNALYVGPAGTGKTTVAKAMCNELGIDSLFVNASESGNIDTLRTLVRTFASTISFQQGKIKCVILDEADYLNPNSTQPSLRGFIEEFASNARFILTANFAHRILEPIKSRCPVIDFTLSKDERREVVMKFNTRMRQILEKEEIKYDVKDLAEIIIRFFPDFRRILNEVQKLSFEGRLSLSSLGLSILEDSVKELVRALKSKKFQQVRKWVVDNSDVDFAQLIKLLYEKMFEFIEPQSVPELILTLNEYDYKRAFVMNSEINLVAMLVQIMGNVRFREIP